MPKIIEIDEQGATDEQIDEAVNHFISLPVTRDRQPVLIFDDADGNPHTYTRTSNGELLFGAVKVKDRDGLRALLAQSLRRGRATIGIGLVEGSVAQEGYDEHSDDIDSSRARNRDHRRNNRR